MMIPFFQREFKPGLLMTALFLSVFSLLLFLGNWQLSRATEKQLILEKAQQASMQVYHPWFTSLTPPKSYEKIKISGYFLSTLFFLDNQHYNHRVGYNVLSPLILDDGSVVMVDRGFIEGDPTRQLLPYVPIDNRQQKLLGYAYFPSQRPWFSGEVLDSVYGDNVVIEWTEPSFFAKFLHKKVQPFILRLNDAKKDGLIREWPLVSMPPERHKAYALQWFFMALVVLVIFIVLNIE